MRGTLGRPATLGNGRVGRACSALAASRPRRGALAVRASASAPQRSSLIPDTLQGLEEDAEYKEYLAALAASGQQAQTREERRKRQRSLDALGAPDFIATCKANGVAPLRRDPARILQLNIGLYCNQACSHCHVESSPLRKAEQASRATVDRVLSLLRAERAKPGGGGVATLDITGGAPELNENFRYLVEQASPLGVEIIDRCNLTVLLEPGQEDTVAFLAKHKVRVLASLPCYSEGNVDAQRGRGVFDRSIAALKALNAAGYGVPGSGLTLDLIYNPGGAFLAPSQAKLEPAYRSELGSVYGISFSSLLALNNMPIKRFADWLLRNGKMEEYMGLLVNAFNPSAGAALMCRDTVSIRWDGVLYDCDFNQQMDLAMTAGIQTQSVNSQSSGDEVPSGSSRPLTIWDFEDLDTLTSRPIRYDNHCYGCTAGSGSSCQGAVA